MYTYIIYYIIYIFKNGFRRITVINKKPKLSAHIHLCKSITSIKIINIIFYLISFTPFCYVYIDTPVFEGKDLHALQTLSSEVLSRYRGGCLSLLSADLIRYVYIYVYTCVDIYVYIYVCICIYIHMECYRDIGEDVHLCYQLI
jgi:hypothetical protein